MNQPDIQRILVAVDGSKRSLKTMAYLAQTPPFRRAVIHLYHVFCGVPESFWDLEREPFSIRPTTQVRAWETHLRKTIEQHMDQCRNMLLEAAIHPKNIQITIHPIRKGIARDIIAESRKGYDAVVFRRRGMSRIPDLIMGGVANKLVSHLDFLPLILAGQKPAGTRILVAMDGSENAMRALDFTRRVLAGHDGDIALVNVLRKGERKDISRDLNPEENSFYEAMEPKMRAMLADAKERLIAAGVNGKHIRMDILMDVSSRAGAIVDMAEKNDYTTIVLGRKGVSRVHDFAMGRVSNKVFHIGRRFHLWLIN
jgi:nucleotide-binding universal stress UspA family protein